MRTIATLVLILILSGCGTIERGIERRITERVRYKVRNIVQEQVAPKLEESYVGRWILQLAGWLTAAGAGGYGAIKHREAARAKNGSK